MPAGHAAVHVMDLSVRYLGRRARALTKVGATIQPGQRVLLTGPSGCGKSTLGLCLSGLIPNSVDVEMTGSVDILGHRTTGFEPGALAEHAGVVFQDPASQFTMLTVADEVAFGLENGGIDPETMQGRVHEALAAVGLAGRAAWKLDRLSGGQQQKVVLAAALAMRPSLLILDEATAHLDPQAGTDLYATVRDLVDATGAALVVIEHDIDRVMPSTVDRMLTLDAGGRVQGDGVVTMDATFSDRDQAASWSRFGMGPPAHVALHAVLYPDEREVPRTAEELARRIAADSRVQAMLRQSGTKAHGSDGALVLQTDNLHVGYAAPSGRNDVLRGVGLTIREGEFVAIVGKNGSGKSTLLRALSGLIRAQSGRVEVDRHTLHTLRPSQRASLVGHVFQNPEHGFVASSVIEEIASSTAGAGVSGPHHVERHIDDLLDTFGLRSVARANPYTLSGGQQRRLSVATALTSAPRVLALDEPTSGQDRESARRLLDVIDRHRERGTAIIAATHDVDLVSERADRVIALADGEIVFDGRPAGFYGRADLLQVTGQCPPMLRRIAALVRSYGGDVPLDMTWRGLEAMAPVTEDEPQLVRPR